MLKYLKIGLILLIVIILYFTSFFEGVDLLISKKSYTVPNVINLNLKEAKKILRKSHLHYLIDKNILSQIKKENVSDQDIIILNQYPEAGEKILRKFKISLYVKIKKESIEVPDLIGMDKVNGIFELENNNLKVGKVIDIKSSVSLYDKIIYQSIIPGQVVKKGSSIDLYVNKGIANKYSIVPYFMNNDINYVKRIEHDFAIGNTETKGIIVSQSFIPGDIKREGSLIQFAITQSSIFNSKMETIKTTPSKQKLKFKIFTYTFSELLGKKNVKIILNADNVKQVLLKKKIISGYTFRKLISYKHYAIIKVYIEQRLVHKEEYR